MKRLVCSVLLLTLLFSLSAFALEGKANIRISNPAQFGGKQLPAGDYKLAFTTTGKDAQVTITSADKKTTVTSSATLVEGPKASRDAVVIDDTGAVKEIWMAGKTQRLTF